MPEPFTAAFVPDASSRPVNGGSNRRHAGPRSPHRVPCRLRVLDPRAGAEWAACGQTVNISSAGMAVQLGKAVPQGTAVEVLVPHPEGEPLRVRGMVVHTRRVLTGTFELGISRCVWE